MLKLDDRALWGNEAADDEDPAVLNSYFVNQSEWSDFFNERFTISIARARKGMGKSALLRQCAYKVSRTNGPLVISIKGTDLVAQKNMVGTTATEYIHVWQQRICSVINRHIGSEIGLAFNDNSITMVETAEISGYKGRNIVGMLVDRMRGKLGPLEITKLESPDSKSLLGRYLKDKDVSIWLLVDDIDATFNNTPEERIHLSTFFSAIRDVASNFKGICIRTSVRSDVWTTIKKYDEALDKVEQYIFDINWSINQFASFFEERIKSYCIRIGKSCLVKEKKRSEVIGLVLEEVFPWGRGVAASYRVIHVYAGGRPRWAAQLCKMAGSEQQRVGSSTVIKFGHIKQILEEYGRFRLDDVSREHKHQCDRISEIVNAFGRQRIKYSTEGLLRFIATTIIPTIKVEIDGISTSSAMVVAHFLYRIGFIHAVRFVDNIPEYYYFEDQPDLLKNYANIDNKMSWMVHPAFHAALSLRYTR